MRTMLLVVLALTAAACADEMPRDVQEATEPVDSAALARDTLPEENALAPGELPPGGYVDWIEDMRQELPIVLQEAAFDRGDALDALRQLYMSRQQRLNDHFGEGGSAFASDEMAQAVGRADAHFQDLMRQLVANDVPDARLREVASSLQLALDEVEAAGMAAGLSPNAPRG